MKECSNCRYCHEQTTINLLQCYGQKNAPIVYSDDTCDSWKPKTDPAGWRDAINDPPDDKEVVIGYCPVGDQMFVGYRTTGYYGDSHSWHILTSMQSTKYMTKKVTHWMPRPESPKEVIAAE